LLMLVGTGLLIILNNLFLFEMHSKQLNLYVMLQLLICLICGVYGFHPDEVENLECTPCHSSMYCTGGSAYTCPANSLPQEFASSIDDCLCVPGYERDGDTCVLGSEPYYYVDGLLRECPVNSRTLVNGSGSIEACVCDAGYELNATNMDGVCVQCPPGFVKAEYSNANCTLCPADTFADMPASTVCTACAENAFSNVGASSCVCDAGYVDSGQNDASGESCEACAPNYYREIGQASCVSCGEHMISPEGSSSELNCSCLGGYCGLNEYNEAYETGCVGKITTECFSCPNNSGTLYPGNQTYPNIGVESCQCLPGYEFNLLKHMTSCLPCELGFYKEVLGNVTCIACPVNFTTGSTASVNLNSCVCAPGLVYVAGNTEESSCEPCPSHTFKKDYSNSSQCANCSTCPLENERITEACSSFQDTQCGPCQDNSNLPLNQDSRTFCDCNAGYEADLTADACVPCAIGTYRNTNSNNSILCMPCPGNLFADVTGSIECTSCSAHCLEGYFVSAECNATRDIECQTCQSCHVGYYSRSIDNSTTDTTCGAQFANNRADTNCSLCDANYYCVDGVRFSCMEYAISATGSYDESQCVCEDGYYMQDGVCVQCPRDSYCLNNTLYPCPEHAYNNFLGSSNVLACNCFRQYYRVLSENDVTCHLCQSGDACLNESAYNCTDDRMLLTPLSDKGSTCTCVNGFYNNEDNTTCIECPLNSYCVEGQRFACSSDRHTLHPRSDSQDLCFCLPGTSSTSQYPNSSCTLCGDNTYCEGDNVVWGCPENSISNQGSTTLSDCKCAVGYEATLNHTNLVCSKCAHGSFKDITNNSACKACTKCSASLHQVYEYEACRAEADAVCSPCTVCPASGQFVSMPCTDDLNAECANCTVCDYSQQYAHYECTIPSPTHDTDCRNINRDVTTCGVGEYRGQHTTTSDSCCASCSYHDTKYLEYTLHTPTSHGTRYNDPYSCPIQCLGHSKLRNPLNHSLGCVSCETGNVLLKDFSIMTDDTQCSFQCRHSYERVTLEDGTEDCVLPPLSASSRNSFMHTVNITNLHYDASGYAITVQHTNFSRFVVVVGSDAPANCSIVRGCCYSEQWRVSELRQAGFLSTVTNDSCSQTPLLPSSKLGPNTLVFTVPDDRLSEVAECSWNINSTDCVLTVSIIDTLLWKVSSQRLVIRVTRAVHYAVVGQQEYLPLNDLAVRVMWAYTVNGLKVYMIRTRIQTQVPFLHVYMRVQGMNQLSEEETEAAKAECERMHSESDEITQTSPDFNLTANVELNTISFWKGNTDSVRVFYTLTTLTSLTTLTTQDALLTESSNIMDVVAIRNMSMLPQMCVAAETQYHFDVLEVKAVSGLGRDQIYAMNRLGNSTHYVRGELGRLTTFIVQALINIPMDIVLKNALAVHFRTSQAHHNMLPFLPNATEMQDGNLDFMFLFREKCRLQGHNCTYEYLRAHQPHAAVHALKSCSYSEQASAKAWIVHYLGVPNDAEHIKAICEKVGEHPSHSFTAFLLNTMAFVDRNLWSTQQDAHGMHSDTIVSYVWGNFDAHTQVESHH